MGSAGIAGDNRLNGMLKTAHEKCAKDGQTANKSNTIIVDSRESTNVTLYNALSNWGLAGRCDCVNRRTGSGRTDRETNPLK
jgi:hypothetical protein